MYGTYGPVGIKGRVYFVTFLTQPLLCYMWHCTVSRSGLNYMSAVRVMVHMYWNTSVAVSCI